MIRKISALAVVSILSLPAVSYANSFSHVRDSTERLMHSRFPSGSVVIIDEEKTNVPGYVHERYAFSDPTCSRGSPQIVDHYGPPINPDDRNLLRRERGQCATFHDGRPDS